jgi:hypothetical protein
MNPVEAALRDCLEARVVSIGSRVRLVAPTIVKVAAIVVVGSALLLFRASQRGRFAETAVVTVVTAVLLLALLPWLLWRARRRLSVERMIAGFMLSKRERNALGFPTPDSSVARREVGKFLLACRDGRPRLIEGLTIHDANDLGLTVRLLVSRRDSVVGVELRRGQQVMTKYAFGH